MSRPLVMIDLLGDKQLQSTLKTLQASTQRQVMRPAIRSGLVPINKEAKRLVPKQSGALKKSIAAKVAYSRRTGQVVGMVGVRHNHKSNGKIPNLYAQRVEFGWDHKSQAARARKGRKYPAFNAPEEAKRAELGTASRRPRPFLRPALQSQRNAAFARMSSKARSQLHRVVDRAAAKGRTIK